MSQSQDALPPGWGWGTLGTVTEAVAQRGPGDGATFQYIDISAVDNIVKQITEARTIPVTDAPSRARQNVRADDVLVSMTRPNLNAVALVPELLHGAVASTGFCVLRARQIESRWLFAAVRSPAFVRAMTDLVQGALYPAVRPADIREYPIPIPPLAEQRRIVVRLEELLASGRAVRAALDVVPAMVELFKQSVLTAAFRGDLTADWRRNRESQVLGSESALQSGSNACEGMPTLPSSWHYSTVDQVAEHDTVVTYGIVLPGPEVPDGVPYVRQQDIEDGRVRVDALARTSPEIANKHARSSLLEGDVLLCIIRHLRVAIVPPGIDGANITQGTVRIRPAPFITSTYLASYLSSPAAQEWMKRCYIGMAMPRINVKDARAVPVAVPPLDEQHEIMRRVEETVQSAERQLAVVRAMQLELRTLEEATLAKALRGELVTQDPAESQPTTPPSEIPNERASDVRRRSRARK